MNHLEPILDFLEPRLPAELYSLLGSERLSIGEADLPTFDARTTFIAPNHFAICFNTGTPLLFNAVCKALAARWNMSPETSGPDAQRFAAGRTELAEIIRSLYDEFKSAARITEPTSFTLNPDQARVAGMVAMQASVFVIAHELGHVSHWLANGDPGRTLTPDQEYDADRFALRMILNVAGERVSEPPEDLRLRYAGALVALRVFNALEHLGNKFSGTHPSPAARIERLSAVVREFVGGTDEFLRITTIGSAIDQQLETIEAALVMPGAAATFARGATADRILQTLSVLIEEGVRGRMPEPAVVRELTTEFSFATPSVASAVARQAAVFYATPRPNETEAQLDTRRRQLALLHKVVPQLPEPLRALFTTNGDAPHV